jgi:hypothetical protein
VLAFVTCAVALQALMFAAVRRSRLSVLPTAQAPRVGTVIRPSYWPGTPVARRAGPQPRLRLCPVAFHRNREPVARPQSLCSRQQPDRALDGRIAAWCRRAIDFVAMFVAQRQ